MEVAYSAPRELDRYQSRALIVGMAGLALTALLALFSPAEQFFRSYLLAFTFLVGISLGCLAIVMIHHLAGGAWGVVIRRLLESATRTLPLTAVLFIPLILGLGHLYEWAVPEKVAADPLLQHKSPYLNTGFFLVRTAIYFGIWLAIAFFLNRWSKQQDEDPDPAIHRRLQVLSGPGLVLFGGTVTFASIDWVMSLDAHWFSTIYGILFMGGQALSAMAFIVAAVVVLSRYQPLAGVVKPRHLNDLGKLMLAFVMLWAYFAFSQFLIIWSANLPEFVPWYIDRLQGPGTVISGLLILFHFALPFLLLLPRNANRNPRILISVAVIVILMRYVDLFWLIGPAHGDHGASESGFHVHALDVVVPVGLGGIWLAYFLRELKSRPLLPINDPQLKEVLAHEGE